MDDAELLVLSVCIFKYEIKAFVSGTESNQIDERFPILLWDKIIKMKNSISEKRNITISTMKIKSSNLAIPLMFTVFGNY